MKFEKQKAQMREEVRSIRAGISSVDRKLAQGALTKRLLSLPAVKHAKCIGVYRAFGSEASLDDVVSALHKQENAPKIAYPLVVNDHAMVFARVGADDDMGIFENPKARVSEYDQSMIVPAQEFDLLLVPGIAFDEHCSRLGQGGGYYDRYLPLLRPDCLTVGICFDEQVVPEVPMEGYDRALDYVVTPTQIFAA